MKAPRSPAARGRLALAGHIPILRGRLGRGPRKSLSASELSTTLQTVCQESITSKSDSGISWDLELAAPFLKSKGLADHVFIHQPRGQDLLDIQNEAYTRWENLILRRLDITLDEPLVGGTKTDWDLMHWGIKLHFEHCSFKRGKSAARLVFPWSGSIRFAGNRFVFPTSGIIGAWLLGFSRMSDVTFQQNDFDNSHIQMTSSRVSDDAPQKKLSWEGHSAYLREDEAYHKAMIRKAHDLPEAVRLTIPGSPYSDATTHVGLGRVTLVGNRGIGSWLMRCDALNYSFRGRNHIQSLSFHESRNDFEDAIVYIGRRERIDTDFRAPFHHRNLFLSTKAVAAGRGDARQVSALERQIDRIEYFLNKEHNASLSDGIGGWLEYWQDRLRHGWRRWSSDFYGSWIRPLMVGALGYLGLNALAWVWIDSFSVTDLVAFTLRRVDRIPFYTAGLQDLYGAEYENLARGSKNWLRAIGLVQNIWIGMWGFAFGKSIRR